MKNLLDIDSATTIGMLVCFIILISIVASFINANDNIKLTLFTPDGKVYKSYLTTRAKITLYNDNTLHFYNENGNLVQYKGSYIIEHLKKDDVK